MRRLARTLAIACALCLQSFVLCFVVLCTGCVGLLVAVDAAHAIPEFMHPPRDLARLPLATHLFTGTVSGHTGPVTDPAARDSEDLIVFTFAVSHVWKGHVPDTVRVVTTRDELMNLEHLQSLEDGERYLVDAGIGLHGDMLYISSDSATRPWTPETEARMRAIGAPYDRDAVTSYLVHQLLEAAESPDGAAEEGDVETVWGHLEAMHGDAVDFVIVQLFDEATLARVEDARDDVDRPDETQDEIVQRRFEERTRQEARDRYRRYRERPARELLTDSDSDARAFALGRLREARDPEILELARRAARDPAAMVRVQAAGIFESHPTPVPSQYAQTIIDLASDAEEAVAGAAARALGNVEGFPPEVERAIRSLIDGADPPVRWSALGALSRQASHDDGAWRLLHTLATSADEQPFSDAARRHLAQTESHPEDVRRVVDRWLARGEHLDIAAIAARSQAWDDALRLRVLERVIGADDLDAALTAATALRWTLPLDPATRPLLRSLRDRIPEADRGRVEQLIREVEAVEVTRGSGARGGR